MYIFRVCTLTHKLQKQSKLLLERAKRAATVPPQGVHDPPIAPQPQEAVGGGDPVGVGFAGIPEERVGNPDFPNHVAVEHEQLHGAVELEAAVVPGLGEEDVDGVLLPGRGQAFNASHTRVLIL